MTRALSSPTVASLLPSLLTAAAQTWSVWSFSTWTHFREAMSHRRTVPSAEVLTKWDPSGSAATPRTCERLALSTERNGHAQEGSRTHPGRVPREGLDELAARSIVQVDVRVIRGGQNHP